LIGPGDQLMGRLGAEAAIRTAFTAKSAPRATTRACTLGMACDPDYEVWTDCRFFLEYEGPDVHVVRLVGIAGGRGFVASLYAAPGLESRAEQLFDTFTTSFRSTAGSDVEPSETAMPYPDSAPMDPEVGCLG